MLGDGKTIPHKINDDQSSVASRNSRKVHKKSKSLKTDLLSNYFKKNENDKKALRDRIFERGKRESNSLKKERAKNDNSNVLTNSMLKKKTILSSTMGRQ